MSAARPPFVMPSCKCRRMDLPNAVPHRAVDGSVHDIVTCTPPAQVSETTSSLRETAATMRRRAEDASWEDTWSPDVTIAVSDLLVVVADWCDEPGPAPRKGVIADRALAVAKAYL